MSLVEPLSITVNAVPYTLACVEIPGATSKVYKDPTGALKFTVSHLTSKAGRTRRLIRLDLVKISPDPFTPSISREVSASVQTVVDEPQDGMFSNTELLNLFKALAAWETDTNVGKVLNGES